MRPRRLAARLAISLTMAALAPALAGAAPPAPDVAREIAPGVLLVPGALVPGQQPDGNSLLLLGNDGAVIVDTGRHVAHTQAVLDAALARGKAPQAIVNTHWHLDHTGGNLLLRQRYPDIPVYASDAIAEARKGFLARYREQLAAAAAAKDADAEAVERARTEMGLIDAGDRLGPTVVVRAREERSLAGRDLVLGLERNAATAGDVWVLDRSTGVLASGDLVTLPVPFLDTACPSGWLAALDDLLRLDFRLLVPGHGEPMTREGLVTYRAAFADLLACVRSSRSDADCAAGWLAAIEPLDRVTDRRFARSMMDYYVQKGLRGAPERLAAACAH